MMTVAIDYVRQEGFPWRTLRHVDELISAGRLEQARQILDEALPPADTGENEEELPPLALFLRARLRLSQGDARAVTDLLRAAEREPALLLRAADETQRWLEGPGREHDTPRLRNELTRMRALHHRALQERRQVPERTRLRPVSPELSDNILRALAPWHQHIRFAWAAECVCRHAPRWRHVELALHMRPRLWHFLPGARERMERLHATMLRDLEGLCGSLRLHVHPLMALPAHVREIRKAAHAIIPPPSTSRQGVSKEDGIRAEDGAAKADGQGKGNILSLPTMLKPAAGHVLRGALAATIVALPVLHGWNYLRHDTTRKQLNVLERRHAAHLARKFWRREAAAHPHLPWASAQAFLLMLKAGDSFSRAPLLDAESRLAWATARHARGELRRLWRHWAHCGAPRVHVAHDRAVLRWPLRRATCPPILMHREEGRWRVAWLETNRLFQYDERGRWRLARGLPHGWLFGFRGLLFAASGRPLPLRGAPGKNDPILPPRRMALAGMISKTSPDPVASAISPHHEKSAAKPLSPLAPRPRGGR